MKHVVHKNLDGSFAVSNERKATIISKDQLRDMLRARGHSEEDINKGMDGWQSNASLDLADEHSSMLGL